MKAIAKPIGRFFKSGFKSTGVSFEKRTYYYDRKPHIGYVVYQNSVVFWLPAKDEIAVCTSMEELKEINTRCKLGLRL